MRYHSQYNSQKTQFEVLSIYDKNVIPRSAFYILNHNTLELELPFPVLQTRETVLVFRKFREAS